MQPTAEYAWAVPTLANEFVATPACERPQEKTALSPFDQASLKPVFGTNEPRGSPEQFLAWARERPHPTQLPAKPLPPSLEAAIQLVWARGPSIAHERHRRLSVLRTVAACLEPMSTVMCSMMSADAVHVARAMALSIRRRARPSATLEDLGDDMYAPHFALWCACLDAMEWPHTRLVKHMMHGFPTVGDIPDSGLWRPCERPADQPFQAFAAQNLSWIARCKRRVISAAQADTQRALACWERTLEEKAAGLILGPFSVAQLNQPGRQFPALGYAQWRPLPRFAIWQKGKYRCIDDGAASATNRSQWHVHP